MQAKIQKEAKVKSLELISGNKVLELSSDFWKFTGKIQFTKSTASLYISDKH